MTFTGLSGVDGDRPDWPLDVDVKWTTIELHSLVLHILFMASVTAWQSRFACWLVFLEKLKNAATDVVEIGRIQLPALDLTEEVIKGIITTLTSLKVICRLRCGAVVCH